MQVDSTQKSSEVDDKGYYTLTVNGRGFGSPPNLILYDDFDKVTSGTDGADGEQVPFTSPLFGQWTGRGYAGISNYAEEGNNLAMQARDFNYSDMNRIASLRVEFGNQTDIFISYAVKVPDGNTFAAASTEEKFPAMSSWKFSWIYKDNGVQVDGKYDMCVPSHAGNGSLIVGGNDGTLGYGDSFWSFWVWDEYNYFAFGQVADKVDPVVNKGYIYLRSVSPKAAVQERDSESYVRFNRPVMFSGVTPFYDRVRFPGWWGNGDNTKFNAYYDNIYVAVGELAFKRFEISDSETYSQSGKIYTLPPVLDNWSDTSVELKVNRDLMGVGNGNYYLHAFDQDNNLVSEGIIVICNACPSPPGEFKVISGN